MGCETFSDLHETMIGDLGIDEGVHDQSINMMQWRAQADAHVRECLQDEPMLLRAVTEVLLDKLASPNDRQQAKSSSPYALKFGMQTDRVPDLRTESFRTMGYTNSKNTAAMMRLLYRQCEAFDGMCNGEQLHFPPRPHVALTYQCFTNE